jgi:ABC-2 type transport system permease protein
MGWRPVIDTIRSEWIKTRTVAMHWVLATIAIAFPVVITVLTALFNGDNPDFDTRSLLEVLGGTSIVGVLLLGVLAAATVTSDFGFNTIRPTFAATPKRLRVMASKVVVMVSYALVSQALVMALGVFVGGAVARGKGATIDVGAYSPSAPIIGGTIALAGLMALVGLGIGMLLRSTPLAVTLLVLWPLLIESLVGALLVLVTKHDNVLRWLPFRAAFRLAAVGDNGDVGGPSRITSGIYFGLVSLAIAMLGAWVVNRRDA